MEGGWVGVQGGEYEKEKEQEEGGRKYGAMNKKTASKREREQERAREG